jgi:phenylalanyl-tRNA synthetase beta chain
MRILESWLREFIDYPFPPEELAEKLGMLGLEVAGIDRLGEKYRGFVVGRVLERNVHPNADRLSVCMVDTGRETLRVVCGAPNVAAGQKVAVGLPGAIVPRSQHDPAGKAFVLTNTAIRGVESAGMICSAYELDLGDDAEGILVLDRSARVGQPLAKALGLDDTAYEIEVTPNRPDWLSHLGVAREIGVLTGRRPHLKQPRLKESTTHARKFLSVSVQDNKNCLRFSARMIRGVRIAPSPPWLADRLSAAGLRPINNVVDVTNYVMLEYGQPMHAFDYALLRGGRIIVKASKGGTSFETLDGKSRSLPEGTVMVCDAERAVSIAGVMGGANSEINEATVDIVLESANWNPSSIRRTSRALGISTDASQRFERGADPNATTLTLDRAAELILKTAGGVLLKGTIDVYPRKVRQRSVVLRNEQVNAVLGTSLSEQQIERCLRLLDIRKSARSGGKRAFSVPTYRVDIEREIDLIEEVARVHGYDRIDDKTIVSIDLDHPFERKHLLADVRDYLIGCGFQECMTNSITNEKNALLGTQTPVRLLNPLSEEMGVMRGSIAPGLLEVVAHNINHGNTDLRLFEVGHVFREGERGSFIPGIDEEPRVCMLLTGFLSPRHWSHVPQPTDIFDLKGQAEQLLERFSLDKGLLISYSTTTSLAEDLIGIEIQGHHAGYLGRVRSEVLKHFGIEQDVFVAEVALRGLEVHRSMSYSPLPRFPKVRRDVAFVVDNSVPAGSILETIRGASSGLLREAQVFDVYQGRNLDPGKKSLAFALELMSFERTLTDAEVENEVNRIVRMVEQKHDASIRRS